MGKILDYVALHFQERSHAATRADCHGELNMKIFRIDSRWQN